MDAGLVEVREPETELTIDVPSGRLPVTVTVEDGRPVRARFRNVPACVVAEGSVGLVDVDVAYGGAFYAFVAAVGAGLAGRAGVRCPRSSSWGGR